MNDARSNPRISPLVIQTEFSFGETSGRGFITNLSDGGAFLSTTLTIPMGQALHLKMIMPWQLGLVEADAEVVWTTEDRGSGAKHDLHGVGIHFDSLDNASKSRLHSYMTRFFQLAAEI